jgi:uncharacterized protein YdeI (YjbR/CyaY-like superfamily)
MPKPDLPVQSFPTPAAWRAWLSKNHDSSDGLRLRLFKKAHDPKAMTYAQALDEALCYGWIDGVKQAYDATSWLQRFTPRRPKSVWSKNNVAHVARLIKDKKMTAAGLAAVEAAKKDGRWKAAYAPASTMAIPADFLKELAKFPKAKAFFESLNKANHYAIGYRLSTAKKPETRQRRMDALLAMMKAGKKIH